jgi:IS605 OrfB family transposase
VKVTRILRANVPTELTAICETMGFVRSDIWRRYGALGNVGKSNQDIRAEIVAAKLYSGLPVDGTIRNETTKNIIDDVLLYKAAAMVKVRRAIYARTKDKAEQKRLYTLLRNDEWQTDNFLHRQMRKHFRHGKSSVANQFIVRSDKQSSKVVEGQLVITIRIAKKYGDDITLTTTSSGKAVDLTGRNLRIIMKNGHTEVHYTAEKGDGRECGVQVIGIDKGYTEAFTDSDGQSHGQTFGTVLTEYSDKASATGKSRNKLHALEKSHRVAGRTTKADRIKANNLGRKKIDARRENAQDRLRGIAYQAAHSIVDKASIVVSEDLTSPIGKKQQWKKFNRRMSSWTKGVLADSLDSVCTQRGAKHSLVNSAYTSQMDSTTGLLKGKRVGDKFYRKNGDVLQADHNAALNVLARLGDREISRFTPYLEVRRILLSRSPAQLSVNRLELGEQSRQPSADKSWIGLNTFS